MKIIIFLLWVLSLVCIGSDSRSFIIKDDGLLDLRAKTKINEIGNELFSKTNIPVYISIEKNNNIDTSKSIKIRIEQMRNYQKNILSSIDLQKYVVLVLVVDQMYVDILMSDDIKDIIDKDDILDGYVVPLLASRDKNTLLAKISAASLNGYAQIADEIAKYQNIKLNSSIGSQGKTAGTIWRVFMYTLVLFGIVAYIVIIMRERRFKQ